MSIVTIQIGQCGNQVGRQMFDTFMVDINDRVASPRVSVKENDEYRDLALNRFFCEKDDKEASAPSWNARAVMIDMEQKVVMHELKESSNSPYWSYPEKCSVVHKKGSGNNWANGYLNLGPVYADTILEKIQAEVEKCDTMEGVIIPMSIAGGTGSGMGSFVTRMVRDEFPRKLMLNQLVWPYSSGEVVVQNYNSLLALHHLLQNTDACLVMANDEIHKICSELLAIKQTSMNDLNKVIALKLASVFCPILKSNGFPLSLGSMLELLSSHPSYKLLTVTNVPHTASDVKHFEHYTWPGIVKELQDSIMKQTVSYRTTETTHDAKVSAATQSSFRAIANMIVLRGLECDTVLTSELQKRFSFPSWLPAEYNMMTCCQKRPLMHHDRSCALVSNNQAPLHLLQSLRDKAWPMFYKKAFLHQYAHYGLGEDEFTEAFSTLAQVIHDYSQL